MADGKKRVVPGLEKDFCYCQLWNFKLCQQRFSKFHCFTVHFDSLSFIHTNSRTFLIQICTGILS